MRRKPGLLGRLQRLAALLPFLGACGTVAGSPFDGSTSDGAPMDGTGADAGPGGDPAFDTAPNDPTGSLDAASNPILFRIHPTGIDGTIYECRTDHVGVFTATTPAFANCDGGSGENPTHQPALPSGIDEGGRFRTEYRYRLPTGFVSPTIQHEYYVHNSLNGVATCASPHTDAEYFTAAATFDPASFPTTTTFPNDDTVQLVNPFIRILFKGASASDSARSGGTFLDANGARFPAAGFLPTAPFDFPFGVNSLRHKYVMSADRTMILMRRFYEARTGGCLQSLKVSGNQGVQAPHDLRCDAWVVNSKGQGLCLFGPTIAVQPFDQFIPPGVGALQAGTITGTANSMSISGSGTNFMSGWIGCHLRMNYRWHRVVSVISTGALTLADRLPFGFSGQPFLFCGAPSDVFVSPTGYIKLRQDNRPVSGKTSRNKCTTDPGCNDADPTHIDYLPP